VQVATERGVDKMKAEVAVLKGLHNVDAAIAAKVEEDEKQRREQEEFDAQDDE
jgi:hypothetical protein